ncbi:HEAT repeat protein [Microdochium trichocladiopsis]|uniref:HEAT repeat protein n=1 Tax=Microdochium trichocladiopsis TaxID=1682393 RepID=A0A9P8YFZ5_9PEZI|nr:HEAT repeat protein [Microdochium trichocladiopsis]KAH7041027.1 HEAT repeat protein [Microdochium trichocladiopsis]
MSDPQAAARNAYFQELKPHCIAINNLSVRATDKKAASKDLIHEVEELYVLLDRPSVSGTPALDHKLADYVFFPLSNVLRNQQDFPIRLIELTIKCLTILIKSGWRSKLPADLSQQLLILLAFIIGGSPGQATKRPVPEETELEAFRALNALLNAAGSSAAGAAALVDTKAIPTLGHAISVVLDGITDGRTAEIQIEALQAITALFASIKDRAALATFFPGIVSALSKLLSPPISPKAQRKVLIQGLEEMKNVLTGMLGDLHVRALLPKVTGTDLDRQQSGDDNNKVLTAPWLKATSTKVQVALAHVLKLRNHADDDVRSAVARMCLSLLDECHQSLSNCASVLVETAIILSEPESEPQLLQTSLEDLARIYPELCDTIKTVVYNWEASLARQMQASDQKLKDQAISNLSKGHKIVASLQITSSVLDSSLAASLRDSAAAALVNAKALEEEHGIDLLKIGDSQEQHQEQARFSPVIFPKPQEASTRAALIGFLKELGASSQYAWLPGTMLSYSRESTGEQQVASFWLSFELLKSRLAHESGIDDFLDLSMAGESDGDTEAVFDDLYTFSVSILDTSEEGETADWRLQALAMEVTTFAASRLEKQFRPELIDILYPITTFLGAPTPKLREHAMISLNSIATSCGYSSVTELVVDNVDYMLNSYSLRLNTFDITPASTQVLRMMVQLTGPQLVPYLDDVVASIFGALDNYHGYPILVEGLFSVLGEIVRQGAAATGLVVARGQEHQEHQEHRINRHRKIATKQIDFDDVQESLDAILERRDRIRSEQWDGDVNASHPKRPWKETPIKTAKELLDEREDKEGSDASGEEAAHVEEKPPPPKTPTFKILARITTFTQHYMTSPTPTLRKSLLDLLCVVSPAIAADEEAFLPLVNAIWPVTIERLYDPETFVVISACKALAALFECSGDFLSSRVKTEWWDQLSRWCSSKKSAATQRRITNANSDKNAARGQGMLVAVHSKLDQLGLAEPDERAASSTYAHFTHATQVWEAARVLLTALVSFVQIDADIFDAILKLVADDLSIDTGLRNALEAVDGDSVWLQMHEHGLAGAQQQPHMALSEFISV